MADREQFEAFVAEYGDRLLHTAFGLCGDWQHAEDLTQQALTAVAARGRRIEDNPAGYAYRCIVRANIDRWRRRRRMPEVVIDPDALASAAAPSRDPDDHLAVLAALRSLPAHQRAIVVLRYLQDLTEADTAAALGITVGAVKSGAARGLQRLRTTEASRFEEIR